jgi:hypothetical protein
MFAVVMQVGAVWLASSVVVGIAVGKMLKNSNEAMENANLAHVMQTSKAPAVSPQSKAS